MDRDRTDTEAKHRGFIEAAHPGFQVRTIRRLGEGQDHVAFEVNGDTIVRFSKTGEAASLRDEVDLLGVVGRLPHARLPRPLATLSGDDHIAYPKLEGTPLIEALEGFGGHRGRLLCRGLGRFLAGLHALPLSEVDGLVDVDAVSLDDLAHEAAETFARVESHIPKGLRTAVGSFCDQPAPVPGATRCLVHNDLGIEHLVVPSDEGVALGVIDWSDCAIGDPLVDFGRLLRDLGEPWLREVLAGYGPARAPVADNLETVEFYAKCGALEDLEYGAAPGNELYLVRAEAALCRLFGPT